MVAEGPLTAAEIYEQVTGGAGIGSLADAQDGAGQLTHRMVERAQRISALRAKTMGGWQGGAGDSAADATLPLVQAAADDAVHLETARTAVGAQMDAFGTAKYSVKPVAPRPPEMTSGDLYNVLTGDGQSYNSKVSGWQADSQGNIEAFGAYHSASASNGGLMPSQYAQIDDSGAPISLATPGQDTQGKTTTGRTATDAGEWARNPGQTGVFGQDRDVSAGRNRDVYGQDVQSGRDQGQGSYQVPGQAPGSGAFDTTHANSYVPPAAAQDGGISSGLPGSPLAISAVGRVASCTAVTAGPEASDQAPVGSGQGPAPALVPDQGLEAGQATSADIAPGPAAGPAPAATGAAARTPVARTPAGSPNAVPAPAPGFPKSACPADPPSAVLPGLAVPTECPWAPRRMGVERKMTTKRRSPLLT